MEMNVCTSAIDKGIAAINAHLGVIKRISEALLHNVKEAESGYYDENYKKVLAIVGAAEKNISRLCASASGAERNLSRLKDRVNEYNETGYRG
jgi:hypothetical protein